MHSDLTDAELREIEERAEAATPADALTVQRYDHGGARLFVDGDMRKLVMDLYYEEDREFYIAARTDVPRLVAEVRRLKTERFALAKLAADEPMFFNPLTAMAVRNLRDKVLAEFATAHHTTAADGAGGVDG